MIYLIATLVVPKEPYYHDPYGPQGRHGGGYRYNDHPGRGQATTATMMLMDVIKAIRILMSMEALVPNMTVPTAQERTRPPIPIWMR